MPLIRSSLVKSCMGMGRIQVHMSETKKPAPPLRVLVVDDHPLLRKGLGSLVSSSGDFKIVGEAADGEQACELAQQLQPDVVLMDVEMPKMNGVEATRRIKTTIPHLIVIGLSIHQSVAVANTMKAAGASAYVTKDAKPEDLHRAIRSALTHQAGSRTAEDHDVRR